MQIKTMNEEILERIEKLYIDCPECEYIIYDDEQYQCITCGGGGQINVLEYFKQTFNNTSKI